MKLIYINFITIIRVILGQFYVPTEGKENCKAHSWENFASQAWVKVGSQPCGKIYSWEYFYRSITCEFCNEFEQMNETILTLGNTSIVPMSFPNIGTFFQKWHFVPIKMNTMSQYWNIVPFFLEGRNMSE